jgi:manganese/zinc/iron transport system substrate-binding protein
MRATRRQFISLAAAAPTALALGGCSLGVEEKGPIADRLIDAVATTGMVGDLVTNVGRERVDLTVLMGAGVDPHLFKASERTLRTMERSDCIFYNGLHLEGGLAFVLEEMGKDQPTVACAEEIPTELLRTPPEFEGAYDPHVWFDISLWQLALQRAIEGMQELDPTSADLYAANGEAYHAELGALEEWVFAQVATVPEERRVLITAHDAFGYFGARYGFEVYGIQGASTSTEAGARDLQKLADLIAEREIPAIFVESSVPRRTVEALREAVQARGFDVIIGGELYSDAMGDRGTFEGTYIGMFQANVNTIVNALLGKESHE